MTFDILRFRAEFTRSMGLLNRYMSELDVAAAELRRRVAAFPVSAS